MTKDEVKKLRMNSPESLQLFNDDVSLCYSGDTN